MLIEYNHVNIYQQDTVILKDVNFGIDKGEFAYIIGKVGSGKSSLLKSLYCELDLYIEDCEKAEILGRNLLTLRRKDVPELRRHLGIIFQDFQLLHDRSVYQNLLFVLKATGWKDKAKVEARIDEVLETVGLSDKKNCLEENNSASLLHVRCSIIPTSSSQMNRRAIWIPRQQNT